MRSITKFLANLNEILRDRKNSRFHAWAKEQQLDSLHKVMGYRKDTPEY